MTELMNLIYNIYIYIIFTVCFVNGTVANLFNAPIFEQCGIALHHNIIIRQSLTSTQDI